MEVVCCLRGVVVSGFGVLRRWTEQTSEDDMANLKRLFGRGTGPAYASLKQFKGMLPSLIVIQFIVDEIVAGIKDCLVASKNATDLSSWKPARSAWSSSFCGGRAICRRAWHQTCAGHSCWLGHSILCAARPLIGDNPFVVVLPDIILMTPAPTLCVITYRYGGAFQWNRSWRGTGKTDGSDLSEALRIVQTKDALEIGGQVGPHRRVHRKPDGPQTLDSDLMAVGRYVLSADVWPELERTEPGRMGPYSVNRCDRRTGEKAVGCDVDDWRELRLREKMAICGFVNYGLRNHKEGAKFESIKQNCWRSFRVSNLSVRG